MQVLWKGKHFLLKICKLPIVVLLLLQTRC